MQEPGHENSVLIAFVTSEGFRELAYLHSLPQTVSWDKGEGSD